VGSHFGVLDCILSEYNGLTSLSKLKTCNEPVFFSYVAPAVKQGQATGKQTFIILLINGPIKIFTGIIGGVHVIFTVLFTFVSGLAMAKALVSAPEDF